LIITPETGYVEALEVAERFRKLVEGYQIRTEKGGFSLTISLGVAAYQAGSLMTLEELVKQADDAMYAAKAQGRNRVSGALKTST
jgi:diguanylate cyclase (GGDEF)-like protein